MSVVLFANANIRRMAFDMREVDYAFQAAAIVLMTAFDMLQLLGNTRNALIIFAPLAILLTKGMVRSGAKSKQWPRLPVTRREIGLALWCETHGFPAIVVILGTMLALMLCRSFGRETPQALSTCLTIAGWQFALIGLPRLASRLLRRAEKLLRAWSWGVSTLFGLAGALALIAGSYRFIVAAVKDPHPNPILMASGLAGAMGIVWQYVEAGRVLPTDSASSRDQVPGGNAGEESAGRRGWAALFPVYYSWARVCLILGALFYGLVRGLTSLIAAGTGATIDSDAEAAIFTGCLVVLGPLSATGMGWANLYGLRSLGRLPIETRTLAFFLLLQGFVLNALVLLGAVLLDLTIDWTHPLLSPVILMPALALGPLGVAFQIRNSRTSAGWIGVIGTLCMIGTIFSSPDDGRFQISGVWVGPASVAVMLLGWVWIYRELVNGRAAYRVRRASADLTTRQTGANA